MKFHIWILIALTNWVNVNFFERLYPGWKNTVTLVGSSFFFWEIIYKAITITCIRILIGAPDDMYRGLGIWIYNNLIYKQWEMFAIWSRETVGAYTLILQPSWCLPSKVNPIILAPEVENLTIFLFAPCCKNTLLRNKRINNLLPFHDIPILLPKSLPHSFH